MPLKFSPMPDRPDHRRAFELQLVGDLVEQLERIARLAVHLVDEGHDRDVAQAADLEQLARLRLDALGRVDHHHRGVGGGQRAIGVFGEILVARRVEQVEDRVLDIRTSSPREVTEMPRSCSIFIQSDLRAPRLAARLDRAGGMDRAAEQQQMLGQRRLAGVGMRDDREGPAARGFGGGRLAHGGGE